MKRHAVSTMVGLGLLLFIGSSWATTIYVPSQQPTIQAGINAAMHWDTVVVASGTFSGAGNRDLDPHGKNIVIRGALFPPTIVDCGGSAAEHHGGFVLHTGDTAWIQYFVITNAYFNLGSNDYGAITILGGSPVIRECEIRDNHSSGIAVNGGVKSTLTNLRISGNVGWGISMPGYPYLSLGGRISHNIIDHNTQGGMILSRAIDSTWVEQNTIADNGGDGLFLQGDMPASLGMLDWDTTTIITGNLIAFNQNRGIYHTGFFTGLHYSKCDIFGNTGGDWAAAFWAKSDTSCILSADPIFCRQGGEKEYTLGATSPCLAINNQCQWLIGAAIEECPNCCVGYRGNVDCDPGGRIDISDLGRLIDYRYISFDPLCCFEAANTDGQGGIDISDLTELIGYLYIWFHPPLSCP